MKYRGQVRAFSFSYPASSLYDLIADGNYRQTHIGRSQWKQLIQGSTLQPNCNREGFNVFHGKYNEVRLGLVGNNENDCKTPDTFIGLGGDDRYYCGPSKSRNTAGNLGQCARPHNGNKNIVAMGYILVR